MDVVFFSHYIIYIGYGQPEDIIIRGPIFRPFNVLLRATTARREKKGHQNIYISHKYLLIYVSYQRFELDSNIKKSSNKHKQITIINNIIVQTT